MYRLHPSWVAVLEHRCQRPDRAADGDPELVLRTTTTTRATSATSPRSAAARCTTSAATTSTCRARCSAASRRGSSRRSCAIRLMGVDVLTSAILDFPSGQATFTCTTRTETDQRVHVYGTNGRMSIGIPFNIPPDRPTEIYVTAGGDPPVAPRTEVHHLPDGRPVHGRSRGFRGGRARRRADRHTRRATPWRTCA